MHMYRCSETVFGGAVGSRKYIRIRIFHRHIIRQRVSQDDKIPDYIMYTNIPILCCCLPSIFPTHSFIQYFTTKIVQRLRYNQHFES